MNDLLLSNGIFHTLDSATPIAGAVAIRAGRFLHVGDRAGALERLGGHRVEEIDLKGRCVLPGLTDAHLHLRWYAEALRSVDVETATLEEAVRRLRARAEAASAGAWIQGSGWNHNVWGAGALPDRGPLDRAAPRNPVALKAKSGHAHLGERACPAGGGDPRGHRGPSRRQDRARRGGGAHGNAAGKRHGPGPGRHPGADHRADGRRAPGRPERAAPGRSGRRARLRQLPGSGGTGASGTARPAQPARGQGDPSRASLPGHRAGIAHRFWRRAVDYRRREALLGRRPGSPDGVDARALRGRRR